MERRYPRLLTPETKRISRTEEAKPRNPRRYGGLVIKSADGIRFAHTDTPLPRDPSARIVPTAEWMGMPLPVFKSPEEEAAWKEEMVKQFEPPPGQPTSNNENNPN